MVISRVRGWEGKWLWWWSLCWVRHSTVFMPWLHVYTGSFMLNQGKWSSWCKKRLAWTKQLESTSAGIWTQVFGILQTALHSLVPLKHSGLALVASKIHKVLLAYLFQATASCPCSLPPLWTLWFMLVCIHWLLPACSLFPFLRREL